MTKEVTKISSKDQAINEERRDREVRVIGADGSQLGIMSGRAALQLAQEANLDLVKIATQATTPVCKIIDYGKYRFEQAKREREARKNQHIVDVKEIKMSMNIDTHDFETKVGHALRFLSEGDKVKCSVRFRGREMAHTDLGGAILRKFAEACSELSVLERAPKLEGRTMSLFISPKPVKQ